MKFSKLFFPAIILESVSIYFLFFFFQPKNDFIPLIEGLKEYSGMLSTYPDVLQVHKVNIILVSIPWKLFGNACEGLHFEFYFAFPVFLNRAQSGR